MGSSSPAFPREGTRPAPQPLWDPAGWGPEWWPIPVTSIWLPQPLQILMCTGEPQQNPGVWQFYCWCSDVFSAIAGFALVVLGQQKENALWRSGCWSWSHSIQQKNEYWAQQNEHLNESRASLYVLTLRFVQLFKTFSREAMLIFAPCSFLAELKKPRMPPAKPSLCLASWEQSPFCGKGLAGVWDFKCSNWSYGKRKRSILWGRILL